MKNKSLKFREVTKYGKSFHHFQVSQAIGLSVRSWYHPGSEEEPLPKELGEDVTDAEVEEMIKISDHIFKSLYFILIVGNIFLYNLKYY